MGIFHRNKTPPPPASEMSHQDPNAIHNPVQNTYTGPVQTNATGTTYTSTNEMAAPQYTQHQAAPLHHDSINQAPPPPANVPSQHYTDEKAAGYGAQPGFVASDPNIHNQQQPQVHQPVYQNHDPNVVNSQAYQQPPQSQSQIHVQQPTSPGPNQYSQADFHAQDKTQIHQQQQQAHNGAVGGQQQFHAGRNNYQVARPLHSLQSRPEVVDCPYCGVRELTRTEFVSGGTTHMAAILLCFCLCLGCIPYIGSWVKNCEHYCGNCNRMLAIWHRSGDTEVINSANLNNIKPGGPGAQPQQQPGQKIVTQ